MATDVLRPYTQAPWAANSVIFPTRAMQLLDNLVNYLGVTILAYCFARRSYHDDLLSIRGWSNLTWPRLTIILTFLSSWIFVFSSSILVNGVGLSYSIMACRMAIYLCVFFYALSKVFLYCFLAEKVYVVWGAGKTTRFRSPVYRLCSLVIALYAVIFILMVMGRISEFRSDGVCVIGLRTFSSIPLLSYDLFINILLTFMFVYPLARSGFVNPKLRSVSARTLAAAGAALTTSSVNITILTIMHGRQLGWVCLISCGTDVTLNALVLFWVTSRGKLETPSVKPPNTAEDNRPSSPCDDDNWPRTPGTFDTPPNVSVAGNETEHKLSEQGLDTRTTTRGVRSWLGRMRSGDASDKTPVEVQVTIMTEMEMDENPGDHYAQDNSVKSTRSSAPSFAASRDPEKESEGVFAL